MSASNATWIQSSVFKVKQFASKIWDFVTLLTFAVSSLVNPVESLNVPLKVQNLQAYFEAKLKESKETTTGNHFQSFKDIWCWIASFNSTKFRVQTFNRICRQFYTIHNNKLACDESQVYLNLDITNYVCFPALKYVCYVVVYYSGNESLAILTQLLVEMKALKGLYLLGEGFAGLRGFEDPIIADLLSEKSHLETFYNKTPYGALSDDAGNWAAAFDNVWWNLHIQTLIINYNSQWCFWCSEVLPNSQRMKRLEVLGINFSLTQFKEICECTALEYFVFSGVVSNELNSNTQFITVNSQSDIDDFFENMLPIKLSLLQSFGMTYRSTQSWNFLFKFPHLKALMIGTPVDQTDTAILKEFLLKMKTETETKTGIETETKTGIETKINTGIETKTNTGIETKTNIKSLCLRLKTFRCRGLDLDLFHLLLQVVPHIEYVSDSPIYADAMIDAAVFNIAISIFTKNNPVYRELYLVSKQAKQDELLLAQRGHSLHLTSTKREILLNLLSNPYRHLLDLHLLKDHIKKAIKQD